MRVGLLYSLGPDCNYDVALEQIEEADRLGLNSVLFEEHHGDLGCPAIMPLIAAAASRTKTIRVGSSNRQLCLEYPINGAEDYAVIDQISRGRVVAGVSAGEREQEFQAAGVPWSEREGRFGEALELLRTVWSQSNVSFVGEHYRFPLHAQGEPGWQREPYKPPFVDQWRRGQIIPEHLPLLPQPLQWPHPPMWVNATSEAIIQLAGSKGYSLLISPLETETEVRAKIDLYDRALGQAGRDRNEVEVALCRELFMDTDGDVARDRALPALRSRIEQLRPQAGEDQSGLAVIRGLSDEELLNQCALYGNHDDLLPRLLSLKAEAGINHLICRTSLPGLNPLDVMHSIRLIASSLHSRLQA
ncbi:MAG: LLM class flavin-dependent oxidoreductase [Halieaceae bacterium]|jgi:alkanesulfonate monooxygenase SsuD/methylene tetrahydromethanopterin reductase-like flavin-dependent oxidoreductase (luciferase family)|nr:LLM class flavin-dependent oxidoreductase [Halieaceae bacterium]